MKNKICLITGATSGIGKETALALADLGATVIVHGRNQEKAEKAKEEIINETGNKSIDTVWADMSSLEEVRQMAEKFSQKYNRLDILINNAGRIMNKEREETIDGYEKTIAINHLSPFLLTGLLFNEIKNSHQARIINLASTAHKYAKPNFNDFMMKNSYNASMAYGNSKLYAILFTREMEKRLKAKGINNIVVNAVHPGVVRTGFALNSNSIMKLLFTLGRPFLTTPQKGAQTSIYLASSPEADKFSGMYFAKKKPAKVKKTYDTQENAQKLWEISEKLTNSNLL